MLPTGRPAGASPQPSRNWFRLLLTPLLCVASVVVGVLVFAQLAQMKEPPPQADPVARVFRVPVYHVQSLTVRPLVSTFGSPIADREVVVAAEVAGRVVEAERLKVGVRVAGPVPTSEANPADSAASAATPGEPDVPATTSAPTGELVVRIDPDEYQERLLQAQALLAQDAAELEKLDRTTENTRQLLTQKEASLTTARKQLDLQRDLDAKGAGRQTDILRAELEFQQHEAAVLQLQTELNLEPARRQQIEAAQTAHDRDVAMARLNLAKANVHAPFAGVIGEVMVESGKYVRPGDPLFRLTNLDIVEVALPLPISRSADIAALLGAGTSPRVQFAEHESADCRWVGEVTRIAPEADLLTRTIDVYAEVDNRSLTDPLRPGMFVHARIDAAERSAVILVPRDAIIDGAVFVAKSESVSDWEATSPEQPVAAAAERRPVTVAGMLQSFAVVTSGLTPGDRVVLSNLDVLKTGSQLQVVQERDVHSELARENVPGFDVLATDDR
jgi:RND family efflux transporter MFP subunit